ncbi:DNA-invertase hin [Cupriavidus yeoncheonensis]|uniref:DNA-invertase hin n=1 Tax=Cupriavidus yeoncheonensis TaxID=1462994 RepID=A0A916IW64_9BURK|nr:recombinase family protein [Cupriavidus yeoncheonensis]CAG2140322.1 DNA-invertase hin [Cupriavidus yeoncheonensis]
MQVGYIRVSSVEQNTERQLDGVQVDKTFTDKASGKDTNRPQLQAALEFVREGDRLVVHSMDRLARNTEDLLRMVRELTGKGVSVQFHKENLTFKADQADPMATLMLTMLGAFAQFERSLLRERQREGIAVAKAKGVYRGRKAALSAEQAVQLRQRVAAGEAKAAVARHFGISRETLYQYIKAEA